MFAVLLADLPPEMHYGIYIMGCIWQPFWILQEKAGISFYFWIIRLVNSQLALYNHVICNPLDTPNTPKTPPHDNYKCQLWGLNLPGVICNIVVTGWSWQICQQIYPPGTRHLLVKTSNWQIFHRSTPKCIMAYIWDVFDSHFGFMKKRQFPYYGIMVGKQSVSIVQM